MRQCYKRLDVKMCKCANEWMYDSLNVWMYKWVSEHMFKCINV